MTLGVIAFLTNTVVALLIITLVFTIEGLSFILQFLSKKIRGKKIFLSSPLHHHLEAIGWPEYKITMRFWIISAVCAVAGLAVAIIGRGIHF
jgi:phospho-N-acetylmuramoyl-pentapeptide-transferase